MKLPSKEPPTDWESALVIASDIIDCYAVPGDRSKKMKYALDLLLDGVSVDRVYEIVRRG